MAAMCAAAMISHNRSLEFALLLTLPAAAALCVVPGPIIQVLFERGAFHAADTRAVAMALAAFAAGLPASVLIRVFLPGFFAREDTRTPMIYAGVSAGVNIVGSLSMFFVLGHVGIAIATSLAAWTNAMLLGDHPRAPRAFPARRGLEAPGRDDRRGQRGDGGGAVVRRLPARPVLRAGERHHGAAARARRSDRRRRHRLSRGGAGDGRGELSLAVAVGGARLEPQALNEFRRGRRNDKCLDLCRDLAMAMPGRNRGRCVLRRVLKPVPAHGFDLIA